MMQFIDNNELTPRNNDNLFGHNVNEQIFLDAWNSKCLPNSWLICGQRGIGKATLAYRIARFVLATSINKHSTFFENESQQTLRIDPNHLVFQRVASGTHADLKIVERNLIYNKKSRLVNEIPVDYVRDIKNFLSLTSSEGSWRVVIIDAIDELSIYGDNAILKILEEPPKNALLLLISHVPNKLSSVISSRCRQLTMHSLSEKIILTLLKQQSIKLNDIDSKSIARLSRGSIGKALSLIKSGGLTLYSDMIKLINDLPYLNIVNLHAFGDRVTQSDESFNIFIELFLEWFIVIINQINRQKINNEIATGESSIQKYLVKTIDIENWILIWEKINNLFNYTYTLNIDRKLVVINSFLIIERYISTLIRK
ncbi:MAG: DNA polymerase III subunit delta' [Rhodospirillaceae bacterium]|jgi:DNA polymerase-3 subunit delta'|nr:DNA polymerase III subunit delta' [Rhodospirillaceae bacterium]